LSAGGTLLAFIQQVLGQVTASFLDERFVLRAAAGDERHHRHRGDVVGIIFS
jgi:hypothetical protein